MCEVKQLRSRDKKTAFVKERRESARKSTSKEEENAVTFS